MVKKNHLTSIKRIFVFVIKRNMASGKIIDMVGKNTGTLLETDNHSTLFACYLFLPFKIISCTFGSTDVTENTKLHVLQICLRLGKIC